MFHQHKLWEASIWFARIKFVSRHEFEWLLLRRHDDELVLCLSLSPDGTSATFFPGPLSIEHMQ